MRMQLTTVHEKINEVDRFSRIVQRAKSETTNNGEQNDRRDEKMVALKRGDDKLKNELLKVLN